MAKERGHRLSLDGLRLLHEAGLLVPLYRVDDEAKEELRIDVSSVMGMNPWVWTMEAAGDGRLRNPLEEGAAAVWPYMRPDDVADEERTHWWNGYTYSPWQLLDLHNILNEYETIKAGWRSEPNHGYRERVRRVVYALAALSPRYLSGVIGRVSLPPGTQEDKLWRFRSESNTLELLQRVGFDPDDLRKEAEWLLGEAHSGDPLAGWLPLVRHASYQGWSKLKGEPLDCMWMRIGAEVLLRAHESLALDGHLEALPTLKGSDWHSPLHDRIGPTAEEADTLERALGTFGLSPHPRVLLLVEGETEFDHVPRMLAEFGLARPERVRVQICKGSKVNTQLIARYGTTPRLGKKIHDTQLIDRTPTALILAMDAENKFETEVQRANERRKLQDAIREEVKLQGGEIGQEDLDYLVEVRVWGEDKYELANFTDDELVPALTQLARQQGSAAVDAPDWEARLRAELAAARTAHCDIKVPMGKMRVREDKLALARLLWPALLAKIEAELAADTVVTPVILLVLDVRRKVAMLSGGGYALGKL